MAIRKGNVVADERVFDWLPAAPVKVRSWQDSVAPATRAAANEAARKSGYVIESVFDASHGRRYLAFIYPYANDADRAAGRRACWDCLTAPGQA